MNQPTLETWEMKVRRLALELKEARPDPFTSSPKQGQRYAEVRYALQSLLNAVE